jgi:hypothetical protein
VSDDNKNAGQPEKDTPPSAAAMPQEPSPVQPTEEKELDDQDYQPHFIAEKLKNPPVLPGEDERDFQALFESYEYGSFSVGRPKTDHEYRLVWAATTLEWELHRLEEMKFKIIASQGRAAAETVFRRNLHVMAPDEDIEDPKATVREFGRRYFSSTDIRDIYNKRLAEGGNGPGAVDAEMFLRSLPSIGAIEKLIVSQERRLSKIWQQLDDCFASRDPEEKMPLSLSAQLHNEAMEKEAEELKKQREELKNQNDK